MKPEELAYKEGFRVDKQGNLFNLNGKTYKTDLTTGKTRFYLRRNYYTNTIYVSRLQAFQKFGFKLYEYNFVRHINLDGLDCSFKNIELGKGSEQLTKKLQKMPKPKRAFELGYRVDRDANLFLNGVKINNKKWVNADNYYMFCIPFKKNKMSSVFIHRLQAFQKFGEELFNAELVMHKDGNSLNNSWQNLKLGTFKENINDISLEVKAQKYLKSAYKNIKWSVETRNKIRKEYLKGERVCDLSRKFKIPYRTTHSIIHYSIV